MSIDMTDCFRRAPRIISSIAALSVNCLKDSSLFDGALSYKFKITLRSQT